MFSFPSRPFLACSALALLGLPRAFAGDPAPDLSARQPYLSEFLADNRGGLEDADGDSPDWIEIANSGQLPEDLGGWFLTDNPALLTKWQFPSPALVPAGQCLLVFASAKDRRVPGSPLHTNFKLDADGDSLLLVRPDGVNIASQILNFPPQKPNISSGTGQFWETRPAVAAGATAKILVPPGPVVDWTAAVGFDDQTWQDATTGVGFDASGGAEDVHLLGYWDFNDATRPGSAVDASGHGLVGTVRSATYTADRGGRSGKPGDRALKCAGAGSVEIRGASLGALDSITQQNAVALSAWIYGAAAQPAASYLFYAGSESGGGGTRVLGAHLPWSDSTLYWDSAGCCDPDRHRIFVGEPNPAMWRGQWNHYLLQKQGDRKEIWQNGSLIHVGKNTERMVNLRSFYLGAANASGVNGYQGLIDDFAIWDQSLNQSQIAALARGSSPLQMHSLRPLISTDLAAAMRPAKPSVLMRLPFTLPASQNYDLIKLTMHYDDGFVAWLNGNQMARRNAPPSLIPAHDAAASAARAAGAGLVAEEIDLSGYQHLLQDGPNLLAIQGLNASPDDPDFLVLPELTLGHSREGQFFTKPTPGAPNGSGYDGFTADTVFAPGRGFYASPQEVTITCATPGARIVYTTDGSLPQLDHGTTSPSPATVKISTTTTLRAAAFAPGAALGPTNVDTHTYLFPSQVVSQQRPAAAPLTWAGGFPGDYAMDARVANQALPGYRLPEALLSLPTLSVVADPADLWGPSGIYAQSTARGDSYERAASAEWLEPNGGDGFHIPFGLAVHGNISREKSFTPKHSFKMFFRSSYGASRLEHPLFADSPVRHFDQLILRAGSTDTFPCTEWAGAAIGPGGASYQRWARAWATYLRDQWVRDSQNAMGSLSAHGRFCHLYLNGIYWGLYNLCEHPDEDFMADHLGGQAAEYDVLVDFAELKNGNYAAWQQLIALANTGLTDAAFLQSQGKNPDGTPNPNFPVLLHADSLIDYMLLHIFHGADDWPNHNWWVGRATRNPTARNDGFHFFAWDQEISNVNVLYERSSWQTAPAKYADANAPNTPAQIYFSLRQNSPEFRLRFADHVQRHLFNGGALSPAAVAARWQARAAEIDHAIVAESARWGDYQANLSHPGQPYRREVEWQAQQKWMLASYWPAIGPAALQRFRAAGLFPSAQAPSLNQHGGSYLPDFRATLTNPNSTGTIAYTLDGTDPRLPGGAMASSALTYRDPLPLSGAPTLRARARVGTTWSALLEANFTPDPDPDRDGIPSGWETAHGLDPLVLGDALADPDGDGFSSLAEYAANTDPHDRASTFAAAPGMAAGVYHLRFTAQAGRRYRLQGSDTLLQWTTLQTRPPGAAALEVTWILPRDPAYRFYRIAAALE